MRKLLLLPVLLLLAMPALAQDRVLVDDKLCDDDSWNNDLENYCEVREYNLKANRDEIIVDGGQNGGIKIEGWDRDEILVRAKVSSHARSESDARDLADKVEISTGRSIEADVPRNTSSWGKKSWVSVSFYVYVPHNSNLRLNTKNGGLSVMDVNGDVSFDVVNGGVTLANLAGDVEGETTNGGVNITLTGDSWEGDGMDVRTTNGGVRLYVPEGYSAQLETGTVNGNVNFEFPISVKGRLDRQISTTLGDGGKTIRVMTTNGGVKVNRS